MRTIAQEISQELYDEAKEAVKNVDFEILNSKNIGDVAPSKLLTVKTNNKLYWFRISLPTSIRNQEYLFNDMLRQVNEKYN